MNNLTTIKKEIKMVKRKNNDNKWPEKIKKLVNISLNIGSIYLLINILPLGVIAILLVNAKEIVNYLDTFYEAFKEVKDGEPMARVYDSNLDCHIALNMKLTENNPYYEEYKDIVELEENVPGKDLDKIEALAQLRKELTALLFLYKIDDKCFYEEEWQTFNDVIYEVLLVNGLAHNYYLVMHDIIRLTLATILVNKEVLTVSSFFPHLSLLTNYGLDVSLLPVVSETINKRITSFKVIDLDLVRQRKKSH